VSQSRETILGRIRTALKDVPDSEKPEDVAVDRSDRTVDSSPRADLIKEFIERVGEYRAKVKTTTADDLPRAIAESCAARNIQKLVIPADLAEGWAPTDLTLIREPGLTFDQLEHGDGVLTACALGIAQTGTVVLDSGPGQGRRAITLLPDYHLCVIFEDQIVGLVPEAVAQLQTAAASPDRPITFISGPSATSDIELIRVEGVHGPRTLEVIVVSSLV
jgi:L-lactate dehydrogenase complex protein LldG